MSTFIQRPKQGEFPAYYTNYIALVPEGNLLQFIEIQGKEIISVLENIPSEKENYQYAEGKWTTKELIGHLIDTERIMAFRALVFSRSESQSIPGFDENDYVDAGGFAARSLASLISEFKSLRASNIDLIASFSEDQLKQTGNANGLKVTVAALCYIIAGHAAHHINILKDRYLA